MQSKSFKEYNVSLSYDVENNGMMRLINCADKLIVNSRWLS